MSEIKKNLKGFSTFPHDTIAEIQRSALSEMFVKPTTMLYRNLLAMEMEELLRSHPVDGAVLMGGCDKTTPGLVMGAVSMGLPFIYVRWPNASRKLSWRGFRVR